MALSSASAHASPDSTCDFSGFDVDGAIRNLIAKFPEYEIIGPEEYHPLFAGFEISGHTVSGFHKLHQYGPAILYCVNGTRRAQVDFLNTGDVVIETAWKHCSGRQGTLSLRSKLSRFTVQFQTELNEQDNETELHYRGPPIPVTTENVQLEVDGLGENVIIASRILAMVFPAVTMQVWNEQFSYPMSVAFFRALNYTCDSC
ncbi:hypothetical protein MTO96_026317 [Rhipicephalus appendiculatus]